MLKINLKQKIILWEVLGLLLLNLPQASFSSTSHNFRNNDIFTADEVRFVMGSSSSASFQSRVRDFSPASAYQLVLLTVEELKKTTS